MQAIHWLPISCASILVLSGCANDSGNDPLGTGPFDSAGNYHEEWANDPSKWSKPGKRNASPAANDDLLPLVAKNEQPPPNANPLAPQGAPTPKVQTRAATAPRETAHVQARSTQVTQSKPKSKSYVSHSKTKSKPKATTKRYTVQKGDSLSRIASRSGTSVSAIQKANGISGTLIHPGKSLVIPKR